MSNLIKSVYFNVDPEKVRVIDSDERVEEYIPAIYDTPKKQAEDFAFPSFEEGIVADGAVSSFEDGMPAVISMRDVVEGEKEKLEKQVLEEQKETIAKARQEAEQIIEQARQEAEAIREEASKLGIEDGRLIGRQEAEQELILKRGELEQEFDMKLEELDNQMRDLEPTFANLVVSLVRKLTGVICEDKKDVILYLIGNAIRNKEKTTKMLIRVSKQDMARVSSKKATFKMLAGEIEDFGIVEDESLTENQCIIELDNKIIDCSLDAQLQNLEEHVKMLVF